jgi:2-C-methyl-D-erythritol 2,4-cyclodiphosphate synthase
MFVGIGYDVHRFKKGRQLVLGGITIPHPRGLDGHSDADVLLHAVMDALLGAAGLRDIGHYFPPGDTRFNNASSLLLLGQVAALLRQKKFRVLNIDTSLIAEEPKIAPHLDHMKTAIATTLRILPARIGIKATTNEGMGFIGRGEGIAALATCSLAKTRSTRL